MLFALNTTNSGRMSPSTTRPRPARTRMPGRTYPRRLPDIEYGADTKVRRVRSNGMIKWRGRLHFISEALIGEPVGLTLITEDCWRIRFAELTLAILDERLGRVIRP